MRIAGIICEYNPLHNGHLYHISETRRILGDETAVVCVMSGNFVQRGDLSIFNKQARAAAAVLCGADLVLEMPVQSAMSSAEGFAEGGVKLLNSMGICTHISFGAECGNAEMLKQAAECLLRRETDILLKKLVDSGLPYALARQQAAVQLWGEWASLLQEPNNNLGVEYLKAVKRTGSYLIPIAVSRQYGAHDSHTGSGLAVRKKMMNFEAWTEYIPKAAAEVFSAEISAGRGPVTAQSIEQAVLYRLRTMKCSEFSLLPGGGDGLGNKLYKAVQTGNTVEEIAALAKSRRHAMSRIRRMILCAYLNLTEADLKEEPCYIRVLAVGERGNVILKRMKEKASLPIITKPADGKNLPGKAGIQFVRDAALTDLYAMAYPVEEWKTCGGEYRSSPFIWKKEENNGYENGDI